MIHYNGCQGNVQLIVNGDISELIADSAVMIHTLYVQLLKKNACVAEIYRDFFENNGYTIFDPDRFDENCKKMNTDTEDSEDAEKLVKSLEEVNELLDEFSKKLKAKKEREEK